MRVGCFFSRSHILKHPHVCLFHLYFTFGLRHPRNKDEKKESRGSRGGRPHNRCNQLHSPAEGLVVAKVHALQKGEIIKKGAFASGCSCASWSFFAVVSYSSSEKCNVFLSTVLFPKVRPLSFLYRLVRPTPLFLPALASDCTKRRRGEGPEASQKKRGGDDTDRSGTQRTKQQKTRVLE